MLELCRVSEIKSDTGLKKTLPNGKEVLLVSRQKQIHAYFNLCPHAFAKLDSFDESFICIDGFHLICTVHGALFRPNDGVCVVGPCKGQKLSALPITVSEGKVWLCES